ncbi:MAG: acyl-CoA thioesterase [SAR86 cluster bacterium BACL1 MAG-121105-bin34]|jgi:acyl-CoA thioesterase II|uniref:Acyl-CoA thioesterase 2 n=2 Tax=SAR86 cluster TaxID=62672 RepID=A0A0R2U9R9_9GAMM|nr:MAG: acyl-CoA thioesterase [SAR86 cluster bacterium BACL1 MAG-120507-bin14]KRO38304.1 MAG: acyl-CoA thioesterase [SAR86 cluster bacterium BACL1 MAG-120920-bin57]KRO95956.1 MAG: acyl-CoA thioesterase [SAR86 cluster bacterium BACL1 MAG-120820-bin45]KRO97636.1 MAG: acyl-CoA thioesterase [SAR86 cluster bacterium BACL1 MAG-120828-bin5]KRO99284.1 MAG: acyl-CoA thioesterase [SAR86 cluster bacterium BACL1 MAG-120823-bin87]KRP00200.1 MAG: acyl-CoA thioesterase [SAR86 cluster bacterium BACL1 MAG-1208
MTKALSKTLNLLKLNKIDRDLFSWNGESVGFKRIFGGQIMAQCLVAGYQTVEKGRMAHSFHSYFLRPGDFKQDIIFEIDRIRDGKSFTTRRVNAIQNGEAIFSSSISFQKREKGLSHQIKMLDIPGPEGLESEWEVRSKMRSKIAKEYLPMWLREREIEMRQVEPQDLLKPQKTPPYRNTWMKPTGKLPADERIHQALLLYVSDMGLLGTAVNPHGMNFMSNKFQGASLDHAIWFHSKINFDNWLLYHIDSPVSNNARGFSRGSIYTKSGRLIASTSQEGLMRVWD